MFDVCSLSFITKLENCDEFCNRANCIKYYVRVTYEIILSSI